MGAAWLDGVNRVSDDRWRWHDEPCTVNVPCSQAVQPRMKTQIVLSNANEFATRSHGRGVSRSRV